MKKLLFLILFLSLPLISFATQGTCSWHGGVNCDAGPDWDGSAICNDGWWDSTEKYYSQKTCTANLHHCSTEVAQQLNNKYLLDKLGDAVNVACKVEANDYSFDNLSSSELRQKAIDALYLAAECKNAVLDYDVAETKYYKECYAIGDQEYQKMLIDLYNDYLKTPPPSQSYSCPSNSSFDGTKCVCNAGYVADGSVCVTGISYCSAKYGSNMTFSGSKRTCECGAGYVFNGSVCVVSSSNTPPPNNFREQILKDPSLCNFKPWSFEPECKDTGAGTPPVVKPKNISPKIDEIHTPRTNDAITVQERPLQTTPSTTSTQSAETIAYQGEVPKTFRTFINKLVSPFKYLWGRMFGY